MNKEKLLKIFGSNIKKFRKERKISIKELAELTGFSEAYLKRIEEGKAYGIKTSSIFVFAKAFNLKPQEIVSNL